MNFIKDYLAHKKIGDVTISKPFFMSKKYLAMLILPVLVIFNKKYDLGLQPQELMGVAVAVAAYIIGQAHQDAHVKAAAIHNQEKAE